MQRLSMNIFKIIIFSTIYFLCVFLSSCGSRDSQDRYDNNYALKYNSQNLLFNAKNSFIERSIISCVEISNEPYIIIRNKSVISIYSFPEFNLVRELKFDIKIGGIGSYDNKLLVKEFESNIIYSVDINSKENNHDFINLPVDDSFVLYSINSKIKVKDNYILLNRVEKTRLPEYFSTYCLYIYNINDGNYKSFGNFPSIFTKGNYMDFYPYADIVEDEILLSFNPLDSIYFFDLSGEFKNVISKKSKYIESINPIDDANKRNPRAYGRYFMKTPLYRDIIYDNYQNLIYRVVTQKTQYINSKDLKSDTNIRAFSIQIFNENMEQLDELYFPAGSYNYRFIFTCKYGLVLPRFITGSNSINFSILELNYE